MDIPVLITGETGTGKDLIAAAIHKRSERKDQPYVTVNTGAMTRELMATELFGHERGAYTGAAATHRGFEQAHRGTIFLDEISTMDEKAQVSLLRVLETKAFHRVGGEKDVLVDVRVLAATNESLEDAVKQGRFREDLYYVSTFFTSICRRCEAVRERSLFLPINRHRFSTPSIRKTERDFARDLSLPEALSLAGQCSGAQERGPAGNSNVSRKRLHSRPSPGRIREASESQAATDMQKTPIHVGMTLDAVEKEFIRMTLESTGGNKKEAAAILSISRRALYNKLEKYGLM